MFRKELIRFCIVLAVGTTIASTVPFNTVRAITSVTQEQKGVYDEDGFFITGKEYENILKEVTEKGHCNVALAEGTVINGRVLHKTIGDFSLFLKRGISGYYMTESYYNTDLYWDNIEDKYNVGSPYGYIEKNGKRYENGDDITEIVTLGTTVKNYSRTRTSFTYTSGFKDTYGNEIDGKGTNFYYTAKEDGVLKFREIDTGKRTGAFTAINVFTTNKSDDKQCDEDFIKASQADSETRLELYKVIKVRKGKTYRISFDSCGAKSKSQFEVVFMRQMDNLDGSKAYKQNTWYIYTQERAMSSRNPLTGKVYSSKEYNHTIRDNCIKLDLKQKSKITLNLWNLQYYHENWSYKIPDISVFDKYLMDRGTRKVLKKFEFKTPIEIGKNYGTITFTLDKGSYYIPINSDVNVDFAFRYKVTPVK